jgi:SSS family solute:Na+ symporter
LVLSGRIAAGVAMVIAIAIVPLLNSYESLFSGVNDIIVHIAPPITTVFLLGVFWKGASAKGAQWTLYIGSLAGVVVFAINKTMLSSSPMYGIHFMVLGLYLFIFCVIILVTISLLKPDETPSTICWSSPLEPLKEPGQGFFGNYKVLSAVLFTIMIILFWKFS